MRLLLAFLFALAATLPAAAERLVSQISRTAIEITSSFDGETVTFYGNVEPALDAPERFVEGPFHVVVVVIGPATARVARQSTRQFGVWLTTEQVVFDNFPGYFQVLASGRLSEITNPVTLAVENILPEAQVRHSSDAGWWRSTVFGRELVRLMTERGLFGVRENAVNFQSPTFYSARLTLPSDVPPGSYLVRSYVFRDGEIIARRNETFAVRKVGFERFLGDMATSQPLLYGLAGVLLALFTGWLGGVIFRR